MYKLESPGERSTVPKLAIVIIILLIVGIIALVIFMGLQKPDSSTQAGSIEFAIATQEFNAGEDLVVGISNATFYLPQGALTVAGRIAIFSRPPNLFSTPGDTKWIRPLVVNVEFQNEAGTPVPHVTFTKPAEICFKITKERWEDYTRHPNEYEVQTYSEEQDPARWEPLPMVTYPERSQLCGQTDHLSLFALATKPDTTIPLTEPTLTPNPIQSQPDDPSRNQSGGVYEP